MTLPAPDDLQEAIRPIASLISKSEKAQQRLVPGSWQYAMLQENLDALRLVLGMMGKRPNDRDPADQEALQAARRAFAGMLVRCEKAQLKFVPGTSQATLLRNRIRALRVADAVIGAELK